MQDREWIKASASQGISNCVQMRRTDQGVQVRDSKDPDGPVLEFTPAEIAAWLDGAQRQEFTHLI